MADKKIDKQAREEAAAKLQQALEGNKASAAATEVSAKSGVATADHLTIKIYSPFRVYFEGSADSISAVNQTGPFDILLDHKNFMTLLSPCEVVVRTKKGQEKFTIERGIMHVRRNRVTVFLDV